MVDEKSSREVVDVGENDVNGWTGPRVVVGVI
jgi:hypothetical protein